MARTLTYQGTATLSTWLEPNDLHNQIANRLTQLGWGFNRLEVVNAISSGQAFLSGLTNPAIAALPTWNYNILIEFTNASEMNDAERERIALTNLLLASNGGWFENVNLKTKYDSSRPAQTFISNYGVYLLAGFAGLLVLTSITRSAAPIAYRYARRY